LSEPERTPILAILATPSGWVIAAAVSTARNVRGDPKRGASRAADGLSLVEPKPISGVITRVQLASLARV
jgi:hypothetical protein